MIIYPIHRPMHSRTIALGLNLLQQSCMAYRSKSSKTADPQITTSSNQMSNKRSNPQNSPQQLKQVFSQQPPSITFKNLLTSFSLCYSFQRGAVPLSSAKQIMQQNGVSTEKFEEYCDRLGIAEGGRVVFDQLLFLVRLQENEGLMIEAKSQQFGQVDQRLIQFLKMLNEHRKKAEQDHKYSEAKGFKQKIQWVRVNELQRIQRYLSSLRDQQIDGLEHKQQESFEDFTNKWDEFMADYNRTVAALIHEISERQNIEIDQYAKNLKEELASRVHYSKKIIDLMARESYLARQQQYSQAESFQKQIARQKQRELIQKQKQHGQTIAKKCENIKKYHAINMNTLLQNVEKDRNDHNKQRKMETEKMLIRKKAILSEISHRHQEALRTAYQALHNLNLDAQRIRPNKAFKLVDSENSH